MRLMSLWPLTVSLVVWPHAAVADPIRIALDGRNVAAQVDLLEGNPAKQTNAVDQKFADDNLVAAVTLSRGGFLGSGAATLSSTVTPAHMSGFGTVTETVTVPPSPEDEFVRFSMAAAVSFFELKFQLDTPHLFDVGALFTGTQPLSQVLLDGPGDQRLIDFAAVAPAQVREKGLLLPGVFRLRIQEFVGESLRTIGTSTQQGEFSFTFDLTPTPEPASLVCLGTGVLGLLSVRRHRTVDA
jgi:hypothetical protein